jgi:hypothetical protein
MNKKSFAKMSHFNKSVKMDRFKVFFSLKKSFINQIIFLIISAKDKFTIK